MPSPYVIPVATAQYWTDELTTAFFACPGCDFPVPYQGAPYPELGDGWPETQTRYCPGCGASIEWVGEWPR